MLVQLPGGDDTNTKVIDVACGSRHTVVLAEAYQLFSFGWNKYGQLGLGDNKTRDSMERIMLPKGRFGKSGGEVKLLRCGDWGTILVTRPSTKRS